MIVDDPVDADETLNTDLVKIHDWSMKCLVKFNPDKTESIIVSRKSNRPLHPPLMMDNSIINMVSQHKHVGLTISNYGNWGKHVDLITKKAFRDRPFNLQGGYGLLIRSEKKFRTTRESEYLFFLSRKALIFFPEINIRLYDKNSESDFFSPTKIRIFFSTTLGIRIFS